jgi:hypothetical protein
MLQASCRTSRTTCGQHGSSSFAEFCPDARWADVVNQRKVNGVGETQVPPMFPALSFAIAQR